MQWPTRRNLVVALAATILFAVSGLAAWPQGGRTIRMILPFPPGGPADIIARLVAQQVGSAGGPTMVVENHRLGEARPVYDVNDAIFCRA